MVLIPIRCPYCQGDHVIKGGKTDTEKQRYRCQNARGPHPSFLLDPAYKGRLPAIKQQVIDMRLNGSGIRDTARVLKISPTTVINELKKASARTPVNKLLLTTLTPSEVEVVIRRAAVAEVDEMGSFVGKTKAQRWLWSAIDHRTGKVLAYVFGRRQDKVFVKLKALLEPCGITRDYADDWGAYQRHLDADEHCPGKRNTPKIERKHLPLRPRIKWLTRQTTCFSRSTQLHDLIIGLFVNRDEFGLPI